MQLPAPFFREAGTGPGVVCLHSNASTSGQWRALTDLLAPRFHVLAADSYGAGKSPPWPTDRVAWLRDEVELLEPVFAAAGDPFSVVGHSYGAAVALVAAAAQPRRIRSLILYEPTLFSLVDAHSPPPNDVDGIRGAVARAGAALDAGDTAGAAQAFIDFWMGAGAWSATPEARKAPVAASMGSVREWARVLMGEPTALQRFAELDIPVLLLTGRDSPASSLSVARLLSAALPRVEVVALERLGHMAPITHPQVVNPVIAGFLERHSP